MLSLYSPSLSVENDLNKALRLIRVLSSIFDNENEIKANVHDIQGNHEEEPDQEAPSSDENVTSLCLTGAKHNLHTD